MVESSSCKPGLQSSGLNFTSSKTKSTSGRTIHQKTGLPLPLLFFLLCSRAEAGEIIRGPECKPHSRPYMAHLDVVTSQNNLKSCGGFLIRQNSVLTAAHCEGRSIIVTLGAHNITEKEDTWQKLEVIKQFPHPKFDYTLTHHDIMLLKLKEKANRTLAVGTLPLPSQFNFILPRRMCQVAGWGITEMDKSGSDTLQEVKLRLMDPKACRHFKMFDHNLQLCMGNPRKTKSASKGDSGGPLLCVGVAHGIVFYGRKDVKLPVVFTRISHYRSWINEVLKEN
ncbi:LOW QUALITY PROTEIN: chymase [Pteropus alecto]|uniref:LOW QUALITY PROTEIN: chymase n=1 Tax=Pteropus alecto TaxID=9402 RepID=UPI0003F152A7|nr:LOW QUALITY PROTEIN: chymase [Pteropus alecto]